MYDVPATIFGLRDVTYKGLQMQQILLKWCICRVKTQYYQLWLLKMFKI